MNTQEFIDAWEAGQEVTVISMGGLSKGYEIAIWEFAVKALNYLENIKPFYWERFDQLDTLNQKIFWDVYRDKAEFGAYGRHGPGEKKGYLAESLDLLGLSGAQWGAAWNAASVISRNGYDIALSMTSEDRQIKLSKGGLSLAPQDLVKVE